MAIKQRFGIGEWYGMPVQFLSNDERRAYATSVGERRACPFKSLSGNRACTKPGGVCTLQKFSLDEAIGRVDVSEPNGLVTVCPYRFEEGGKIFSWIGHELLSNNRPQVVGEVGFLEGESSEVGRIDNILAVVHDSRLDWCALEIQAVYFSGRSMSSDFMAWSKQRSNSLVFPTGIRRPDFRSSGPKRLMPQLQIKVPTLRRWGKKMAVVIDEPFYRSLSPMQSESDPSNADIGWFVVSYTAIKQRFELTPRFVAYTTLERAVEGLTAGKPVSLETFEQRIRSKLGLADI